MEDTVPEPCVSARVTTSDANQGNITENPPSSPKLLTLPAEIRLTIYEYIFSKECVFVSAQSPYSPKLWRDKSEHQEPPKYHHALYPLMVCRQIRREAMPTFHALVTLDLTCISEPISVVPELGPDICQNITSIRIDSRLVNWMADCLREGMGLTRNYRHLLPSLRHVYMPDHPELMKSDLQRELAVKALRIVLGHDDLHVHIGRHPKYGP